MGEVSEYFAFPYQLSFRQCCKVIILSSHTGTICTTEEKVKKAIALNLPHPMDKINPA